VWATQPVQTRSPMVFDGERYAARSIQVGVEPVFHEITATISSAADRVAVILMPLLGAASDSGVVVYYDGVVLARGNRQGVPVFDSVGGHAGTWDKQPFANQVRNGSAEVTGPRVRPWAERSLRKYGRRSPSQLLTSILDWEYTGWVYSVTTRRLFQSFWARFGWNDIGISSGWYWVLGTLTVLGTVGAVVGIAKAYRDGRSVSWTRAVALLALAGLLLWGNAFLRLHPVVYPNPFLPVARYAYPAIIPTVIALAGGWWTLSPRRCRRWYTVGLFSILGVLDITCLWTILLFNYGR